MHDENAPPGFFMSRGRYDPWSNGMFDGFLKDARQFAEGSMATCRYHNRPF